jgi:hypothetical protein
LEPGQRRQGLQAVVGQRAVGDLQFGERGRAGQGLGRVVAQNRAAHLQRLKLPQLREVRDPGRRHVRGVPEFDPGQRRELGQALEHRVVGLGPREGDAADHPLLPDLVVPEFPAGRVDALDRVRLRPAGRRGRRRETRRRRERAKRTHRHALRTRRNPRGWMRRAELAVERNSSRR